MGALLALLGVLAAAFSSLETAGKGALTAFYVLLVAHWLRTHRRRVPADSRLNLLPDGEVLLRLDGAMTWRGCLAPQSWRSSQLVLLRVSVPFGSVWLPVCRYRQQEHQYRRLLVGLRHDRWRLMTGSE